MESKYAPQLEEVMKLIVTHAPRPKIIAKGKEVKIELTKGFSDIQQAIMSLDNMINIHSPDPDWPLGFWQPPQPASAQRFVVQSGFTRQKATGLQVRPARILEVAKGASAEGSVLTKTIIDQLRAEGDQRPDRALAVSVGNVLTRHGWQRVEQGKYKLIEKKEGKEAK